MPVRGVDDNRVGARLDQQPRTFEARVAHGRGPRDSQAAERIFAREGIEHRLLDVLDGQKPGQLAARVDHQQLLDAPRLHQALGFGEVRRLAQHREVVRRHHRAHRRGVVARKAHIAVGDDTEHDTVGVDDRKAGDAETLLEPLGVGERLSGIERDRGVDDARDETLDPLDLGSLVLGLEIAVDDPEPT